jgi:hypothetical protein
MYIVSQDRNHIARYRGELHTRPAIYDGKLMGINLCAGDHMLGTFDSLEEALTEMHRILACHRPVYWVRGYAAAPKGTHRQAGARRFDARGVD